MPYAVCLLALLAVSPALHAQGSGSVEPGPSAGGGGFPERPFEVTKSATGKLTSLAGGLVVLEDEKIREPRKLKMPANGKIRVVADKRSELGGKKKLSIQDLQAGMYVKITYKPEDNSIIEIRVLKPKAA